MGQTANGASARERLLAGAIAHVSEHGVGEISLRGDGRRARHQPPDADLPLRLPRGAADRGHPDRRGAAARGARADPRAGGRRPAGGDHAPDVGARRRRGPVAERAALLRGLRAGAPGPPARGAAARRDRRRLGGAAGRARRARAPARGGRAGAARGRGRASAARSARHARSAAVDAAMERYIDGLRRSSRSSASGRSGRLARRWRSERAVAPRGGAGDPRGGAERALRGLDVASASVSVWEREERRLRTLVNVGLLGPASSSPGRRGLSRRHVPVARQAARARTRTASATATRPTSPRRASSRRSARTPRRRADRLAQRGLGSLWVATMPGGRPLTAGDIPRVVRAANEVARALDDAAAAGSRERCAGSTWRAPRSPPRAPQLPSASAGAPPR